MPRTLARVAFAAAALNLAAGLGTLLFLSGGTPLVPDAFERATFVDDRRVGWTIGWGLWSAAAISLVAFYAVLVPEGAAGRFALALATAGLAVDLFTEGALIAVLPSLAPGSAERATLESLAWTTTGLVANGLYTFAGAVATWVAWQRGHLGTNLAAASVPVWVAGGALSIATLADAPLAMAGATAILTALAVGWLFLVGWMSWRAS